MAPRFKEYLPQLKKSSRDNMSNLLSPLVITPNWFPPHVAYTMKKGYSSKATGGQVEGLFTKIQTAINPEMAEKINALYEFNVSGKEEGVWHIDLRTGNAAAGPGPAPSKPDATLKMNSDKFIDLFSGKLKASTALMTGKLKISGNLQKAMKLEKLLSSLKEKL